MQLFMINSILFDKKTKNTKKIGVFIFKYQKDMIKSEIFQFDIENQEDELNSCVSSTKNFFQTKFIFNSILENKTEYYNNELLSIQFDLLAEKRNLIISTSIINYVSSKTSIRMDVFEEDIIKCIEADLDEIVKILIYSNFTNNIKNLNVFSERMKIQMLLPKNTNKL